MLLVSQTAPHGCNVRSLIDSSCSFRSSIAVDESLYTTVGFESLTDYYKWC